MSNADSSSGSGLDEVVATLRGVSDEVTAARSEIADERKTRGDVIAAEAQTRGKQFRRLTVAVVIALLAVAAALTATVKANRATSQAKQAAAQVAVESAQRAKDNCDAINVGTSATRTLVEKATSGSAGADYTKLPEFAAVEPGTKAFLLALRAVNTTTGNPELRTTLLDGLVLRDCTKLAPEA